MQYSHHEPTRRATVNVDLIEDEDDLASLIPAWDELAAAAGLPSATSGWMHGYWRHLRPNGAQLRVVVVSERGRVVAIAPYFASPPEGPRTDYRLLGSGTTAGISPLATPSREWAAAGPIARTLAGARPRPNLVTFEGLPLASPWPALLREHWPGAIRPTAWRPSIMGSPVVNLAYDSFDVWMASKSSNFRSQMRRMRRQLERAGGRIRTSSAETLEADIAAMLRLHEERWRDRGASGVTPVADRLARLFAEIGRDGDERRALRLEIQVVEVEGEPISVQAFVIAGRTVGYWNGGWDERFAKLKPAMLGILAAIESAFERGDYCVSLGAGTQPYKMRFADGVEPVTWGHLIVPNARAPVTIAQLAPRALTTVAKRLALRGLTREQQERLKSLRHRVRR